MLPHVTQPVINSEVADLTPGSLVLMLGLFPSTSEGGPIDQWSFS